MNDRKTLVAPVKPTVTFCCWCLRPFVRDDVLVTNSDSGMSVHLGCSRLVAECVRQHDEANPLTADYATIERRAMALQASGVPLDRTLTTGRLQKSPEGVGSETDAGEVPVGPSKETSNGKA